MTRPLPALALLGLLLALAASGCDAFDRPRVPVPASFEAVTLEGRPLDREDLRGRPWVIAVWAPG